MTHNCTNPPHFPPHCGCPAGFNDHRDNDGRLVAFELTKEGNDGS
jgi:hypothetical protein